MNKLRLVFLLLAVAVVPGCVYTNVVTPLDIDLNPTVFGSKVGKAEAQSILYLVAWGDRGVHAAATNGGITIAHHMDIQTLSILGGLYRRHTTIVYGE